MDQPTNDRSGVLQALAWVGKVAVEGIAVAIALAFLAPVIADRVALANPTCNDPRGLQLVASSELRADGKAYPAERHHL